MKRKIWLVVAVAVILAFASGSVFAMDKGACPAGEERTGYKDKNHDIGKALNLTPEQDKLLKDAKAAHRNTMETLVKTLKDKKQALSDALSNPAVTRPEIDAISSEVKTLQSQLVDCRIDGIMKIREVLTPEQFQKLQGMKKDWQKNKRGKHFERGEHQDQR